jgi:hypothetical protein
MRKLGIAALVCFTVCGMLAAQSKDWPDEKSILDQARKNYDKQNNDQKDDFADIFSALVDAESNSDKDQGNEESKSRFTPFVLSFVPGLSLPFGDLRTIAALGIIGSGVSEFYGFQTASVFSLAYRGGAGLQASGVFNIAGGTFLGVQTAGVFNIADKSMRGGQAAGVFNIAGDDSGPVQLGGVFNIAGKGFSGVQAAGVFNIAGKQMRGVQAAGVLNVADGMDGIQVSGVVNTAGKAKGLQIGLVNIADTMEGLQLGLINIAISGIHSMGFLYDQNDFSYAFSQNGTNNFYTLVYGGMKKDDWLINANSLTLGAGFGFRFKFWEMYIDADLSAKSYVTNYFSKLAGKLKSVEWNYPQIYSAFSKTPIPAVFPCARVSIGLPIFLGIEIFGGVSMDIAIDSLYSTPETFKTGTPYGFKMLGQDIEVYPKVFLGVKL